MNEQNRVMHWVFVIGLVVIAVTTLYPPSERLKGGIDLVGGSSLLFEIDTTGLEPGQQSSLSTRVMDILKERVDPKGNLNLEWRPVGNTRLEVRMPRPPKIALERRAAYEAAIAQIEERNVRRRETEEALNLSGEQREAALRGLVRGVEAREALLQNVKTAYDEYLESQSGEDADAAAAKVDAYEQAMAELLATNLPVQRLEDVLAISGTGSQVEERRAAEIAALREKHPSYDAPGNKLITEAIEAYELWSRNKAQLEDPSDLKRRLRGAGVLEFRILADRDPSDPSFTTDPSPRFREPIQKYIDQLQTYGPRPRPNANFVWLKVDDIRTFMRVKDLELFRSTKDAPGQPIVEEYAGNWYVLAHAAPDYSMLHGSKGGTPWRLLRAIGSRDPMSGQNTVNFTLDARGGVAFGNLTGAHIGRQLCIVLDDSATSFATIQSRITTNCQITGDFTPERVQDLVRTLESGSLPARLKETPLAENTFGPSLGETNRKAGLLATQIGFIAVVLFVLVYYRVAGFVASLALALNLLFVLSIMALMQSTFTMPGIAGLILTVGMAVDANVLIFERIREERERGVVFRKALAAGYDKAFSTIMDANLTTLLTCVILGFVGSSEVKGFAIVLGIGIVTSMFTALFVTRLVFTTLLAKGIIKDLSMSQFIKKPSIDWLSLRTKFWPVSIVAVGAGLFLFLGLSTTNKEAVFDIEFLGGTSVQIDFQPGVEMNDEQVRKAITSQEAGSSVSWLKDAATHLEEATVVAGETPGAFVISSGVLTGSQIETLVRERMDDRVERTATEVGGQRVSYLGRSGEALSMDDVKSVLAAAAEDARKAAERLRTARVQSVGVGDDASAGRSFEVVTTETNRGLVQDAIVAVLGDRLKIEKSLSYTLATDDETTREPYFVIEENDEYLSDVIGGDAINDVRHYRGGVAVVAELTDSENPVSVEEVERRMREVVLQREFQHLKVRESEVFPLGEATPLAGGGSGYKKFAVASFDESLTYEDDTSLWASSVAEPQLSLIEAALGSEKSLSKVVRFDPTIAGQATNQAIFAIVLALVAIVSYLWIRFGSKDYGLAAIVALVHDVSITLGLVAVSYFVFDNPIGKLLMIDDFKIDLPMIAAILTVIGYSLNDTIVVFDRIRENKGRTAALSHNLINESLNQTLSRTVLTSLTTFLVVFILYAFGGSGVHGFSFALLIGVIVGTYSSLAVAAPLLHRPRVLRTVVAAIVALGLLGIIWVEVASLPGRLVLSGAALVGVAIGLRRALGDGSLPSGRAAPANA